MSADKLPSKMTKQEIAALPSILRLGTLTQRNREAAALVIEKMRATLIEFAGAQSDVKFGYSHFGVGAPDWSF